MKLYEISQELSQTIEAYNQEQTPEQIKIIEEQLTALSMRLDDKVTAIGHWVRNQESDVDALDNEIKRLQARKRQIENHVDWVKEYVKNHLEAVGIPRVKSASVTVSIVKNPKKVVITDATKIPDAFMRVIPEQKEPDKNLIKETWEKGVGVDGTQIVQETRLKVS